MAQSPPSRRGLRRCRRRHIIFMCGLELLVPLFMNQLFDINLRKSASTSMERKYAKKKKDDTNLFFTTQELYQFRVGGIKISRTLARTPCSTFNPDPTVIHRDDDRVLCLATPAHVSTHTKASVVKWGETPVSALHMGLKSWSTSGMAAR